MFTYQSTAMRIVDRLGAGLQRWGTVASWYCQGESREEQQHAKVFFLHARASLLIDGARWRTVNRHPDIRRIQ
jgi:hypothetical protein